ncbi:ABC-three component system protein [Yersinia enterocolitica]
MLRRFRLERKSDYEKLVIAQRLADMLEKFLSGRLAPLAIGAEQGGIDEWDDVVIMHTTDHYEHLQIKRQSTDFCTKNPDKDIQLAKKPRKGTSPISPANSVLDSAFSSLARTEKAGKLDEYPDREFKLTLVGLHLLIKDNFSVNHLEEVCDLCRQKGLSIEELARRQDGPTTRAYLWLTTWCGFEDWGQIRNVLRRVQISCIGNDATLKDRTIHSLGRYFSDPKRTLDRLITYIATETSDVAALGCHDVVQELRSELRPDVETWAQYQLSDGSTMASKSWSLAGTLDLASPITRSAKGVVEHMWSNEPGNRKLRVYANYSPPAGDNLTLPLAIVRLALHLPQGSQGLMLGEQAWRSSVGHEIGHTLGCAEHDFSDLPWLENSERLVCAQDYEFETLSAARGEAEALAEAMDDMLWQRLIQGVSAKLGSISDSALADAMETVWQSWLAGFTAVPESRRKFMYQLLYPKTERKNEKHALRLGLRTLNLLVTAVETLLLVAVGFPEGSNNWESFQECGPVLSIALKYWSGPAGGFSGVRELSDDPLIAVIGPDPDPIVILSGVSTSPSELLNIGMADDAETATSMAAERQPHLLVTRSGMFRHLQSGTLDSVRQHFAKQWQDRKLARESAIEKNTKGS